MTTKTKAILGVGLVAGLGVAMMPLVSYADTDSSSATVTVAVAESITITELDNTAIGLNFSGADISAGTVRTGNHAVTVSTSAASGWQLAMRSGAATLNLRTATGPDVFAGASGFSGVDTANAATLTAANLAAASNQATVATPAAFAASAPTAGLWGFRLAGWAANGFANVPTTDFIIAANNAAGTATTTVTFGAQAGTTTPSGTYGAWITYTATTQ
ncbi:hypothetical protein FWC63_00160 [Candidatus Saccharibacteria bacterium]|nr:hypothetical protein [Candidatus Saccharibacteria bacterium]